MDVRVVEKMRFDDVAPENPDGTIEYAYQGFNLRILAGENEFIIRVYDEEPTVLCVLFPREARTMKEAKDLVEFLLQELFATEIRFYCPVLGYYRGVDPNTLRFRQ